MVRDDHCNLAAVDDSVAPMVNVFITYDLQILPTL